MLVVWVQLYKSYQDLLDPKWKGKFGIEVDDSDWFTALVNQIGEAKGLKLFRDIVGAKGTRCAPGVAQ